MKKLTIKELSQLYYLNREIEQDARRLMELEAAATGVSAKITGMPHVSGISDKAALAAEIADAKTELEAKHRLCVVEYNRLNRFVAGIDDSFMRQIISLRYINGFTWRQVAFHIGGGNTEESIRQRHKRFFEEP